MATRLERMQKYSIDDTQRYLTNLGGLCTRHTYKGFSYLIHSRKGHGVSYYFYNKEGLFIKIREWIWHKDLTLYPQRYIDSVLISKLERAKL